MNFWEDIKNKAKKQCRVSDITVDMYKKISACGTNQFVTVKPLFYLGSLGACAMDYMDYADKLLKIKEKDYSDAFKTMLYMRECCGVMLSHIQNAGEPLEHLIQHMEEIYEGEEYEDEYEDEEYEEKEYDEAGESIREKAVPEDRKYHREDFAADREALARDLRGRLHEICGSESLSAVLAQSISFVYLECVQFTRELYRLNNAPPEDVATILSILVDIQFGLEVQLKNYISEGMSKDEEYNFNLGLMVWSAHFLNELTQKLNKEEFVLVK